MILTDAQARERWRWAPWFKPEELECHHCHSLRIDTDFMDLLVEIRLAFNRPMPINSGYRCPQHNARVSSTGATGPHTDAAVDVAVSGRDAFDLVAIAYDHGVTGIGVRQHGQHEARFIHLDTIRRFGVPRPWMWSYA